MIQTKKKKKNTDIIINLDGQLKTTVKRYKEFLKRNSTHNQVKLSSNNHVYKTAVIYFSYYL